MRRKTMLLSILGSFVTLVVAFALASYIILTLDPFKWGVVQSSKFNWDKFDKIKEGDPVASVISQLGEPVLPAEPLKSIDPKDPCIKGGCKKYVFAGGLWGPTFREAIIIADRNGFVIRSIERQE